MLGKISTILFVLVLAYSSPLFQPKTSSLGDKRIPFCGLTPISKEMYPFDQYYYL